MTGIFFLLCKDYMNCNINESTVNEIRNELKFYYKDYMNCNINGSTVNEIRNVLKFYYKDQWWNGQVTGVSIPIQNRAYITIANYFIKLNPVITENNTYLFCVSGFTAIWILDHETKKYYIDFHEEGNITYDGRIKKPILACKLNSNKFEAINNMNDFKTFVHYIDHIRLRTSLFANKITDPTCICTDVSVPSVLSSVGNDDDDKFDFETMNVINESIKTPNELLYIYHMTIMCK